MFAIQLIRRLCCAGLFLVAAFGLPARAAAESPALRPLVAVLQQAVADGKVVGAQLAVGDAKGLLASRRLGKLAPGSSTEVDDKTLFCIGSCSKPVAAACVLALVDRETMSLDDRVSKWLPAFARLEVKGGAAARRGPTVRELLAHRGGVYSQSERLTIPQRSAIRTFTLTLEKSVDLVARQKLLWQPGDDYAYSGAGYCVLGRAAEVASHKSFEAVLQEKLARPLGLERTTYFPGPKEKNVALPGEKAAAPPHTHGADHRLPLIGGSLYSTAVETAAFARMMLNHGRAAGKQVLSQGAWRECVRRQYPGQNYGLGWGLGFAPANKERARSLHHTGALGGCRSVLHIDLAGGCYFVAHWTLADPADDESEKLAGRLGKAWQAAAAKLKPAGR